MAIISLTCVEDGTRDIHVACLRRMSARRGLSDCSFGGVSCGDLEVDAGLEMASCAFGLGEVSVRMSVLRLGLMSLPYCGIRGRGLDQDNILTSSCVNVKSRF